MQARENCPEIGDVARQQSVERFCKTADQDIGIWPPDDLARSALRNVAGPCGTSAGSVTLRPRLIRRDPESSEKFVDGERIAVEGWPELDNRKRANDQSAVATPPQQLHGTEPKRWIVERDVEQDVAVDAQAITPLARRYAACEAIRLCALANLAFRGAFWRNR